PGPRIIVGAALQAGCNMAPSVRYGSDFPLLSGVMPQAAYTVCTNGFDSSEQTAGKSTRTCIDTSSPSSLFNLAINSLCFTLEVVRASIVYSAWSFSEFKLITPCIFP